MLSFIVGYFLESIYEFDLIIRLFLYMVGVF